jgi:FPC/CPF motif-containing protein YcgG
MSNQIRSFAQDCLFNYGNCVESLPDFVRHEFAALLMSQEDAYASEATGPDNPQWETKMLPALIRYLKNSTDRDEAIEFNAIWRDCVTQYALQEMQTLLEEADYYSSVLM